jgi:hypothetical protein
MEELSLMKNLLVRAVAIRTLVKRVNAGRA